MMDGRCMAIYGQCPTILPDGTQCHRYANHKSACRATLTKKGGKAG